MGFISSALLSMVFFSIREEAFSGWEEDGGGGRGMTTNCPIGGGVGG